MWCGLRFGALLTPEGIRESNGNRSPCEHQSHKLSFIRQRTWTIKGPEIYETTEGLMPMGNQQTNFSQFAQEGIDEALWQAAADLGSQDSDVAGMVTRQYALHFLFALVALHFSWFRSHQNCWSHEWLKPVDCVHYTSMKKSTGRNGSRPYWNHSAGLWALALRCFECFITKFDVLPKLQNALNHFYSQHENHWKSTWLQVAHKV